MEIENQNSIEATSTQDTDTDIILDLDDDTTDDESDIDWKAEAEKKDKAYKDQKTRAEIAEKKLKDKGSTKPVSTKEEGVLSIKDNYALQKANVDIQDIDEVIEFAKFKKISVAEALDSGILKSILAENVEKRNVAQASHTGASRRSSSKISDDVLINNASKGELPESASDIERMNLLRWGKKS